MLLLPHRCTRSASTVLMSPLRCPLLNFLSSSPCPLRPSPPAPWFFLFPSLFPSSSPCSFCTRMVCLGVPASKPDAQLHLQEIPRFSPAFRGRTQDRCCILAVKPQQAFTQVLNGDVQSFVTLRNVASFCKNCQSTSLM